MKICEIVDKLKSFHPPNDNPHTSDVFKYGDPDKECTGVVVTCHASVDVIRKAAELGANFIICHEPVFYNHPDDTDWLKDNSVFQAKKKLLDDAGIVIWRDHDSIHGGPPGKPREYEDLIFVGIMRVLGWERYLAGDPKKPLLYKMPPTTVREIARELIQKLNLKGMRVVGNPDAQVSTVFICEHVFGNEKDNQITARADAEGYDVLIPLEIVDWTVGEYVRDACQLGKPKAILVPGHFNFEEPGMKHMADWLPGVIDRAAPVHYVQSGDSFSYIV